MSRFTSFLLHMAIIALTLLLIVGVQDAIGQTYLTIPGSSYHGDRSRTWNETNAGVGIEYKGGTLGYYRNSYDKDTFYMGWVWRPIELGQYVKVGGMAALASGYRHPVIAALTANVGTDQVSMDILVAPAVAEKTTWFVGAQLRLRLE